MGDEWAVPGSDKWDQLYASSSAEEEEEAADESTVRGAGPLGLPEPEPQPAAGGFARVGLPHDPVAQGRERLHSMLRSSCEWWDRTELSPSAREEWYSVKGQWSTPGKDGDCSLDVLGVPMEIRNKQLRQEQERKDASMAIELSNQDAKEEVALMQQMAKDAELARTLESHGTQQPAAAAGDPSAPAADPWGASPLLQRPASTAPGAQSPLVVEVSVPPGAQSGSKLQVEIPDGRFVEVTLPAGATPGELLRVQVPAAPAPGASPSSGVSHARVSGDLAVDQLDEEEALARALEESMTPRPRTAVSSGVGTPVVAAAQHVDEQLVGELVMMGIEEDVATAAAMAVRNSSVEAAMEHIFSGAGAATAPVLTTGQLEVPHATPLAADTVPSLPQDDIVLLPQGSAAPPFGSHTESVPLESEGTPGCPRCEEMESTCGICLAATIAAPVSAVVDVGDAAGSQRIAQVCAMGFSQEAAASALEVSGQSVEGAIDLLLSQPPT
jgi:hypothetical protein